MPPEVIDLVSSSSSDDDDGPLPPAPAAADTSNKRKRGGGAREGDDDDDDDDAEATARRRIMQQAAQRVAAAAAPANPLTAQLHRERLARQAAAAAARGGAAAGAGSGSAAAPKSSAAPSPSSSTSRPPSFSLLTFNVWFEERFPVAERMPLVSSVITDECGLPDVVLLQEVTAESHALLRASAWAARYEWSPTPPSGCPYYTLLLVRRDSPLRSGSGGGTGGGAGAGAGASAAFRWRPFASSQMGRGLQTCAVSSGRGFVPPLVVATTHLESPTPPAAWYSEERQGQLRASLALLDGHEPGGSSSSSSSPCPNVLIAGDMNWGEKDREMPLRDGWQDAWLSAGRRERGGGGGGGGGEGGGGGASVQDVTDDPRDGGWTYDARTNGMLRSRLRLRLDRCLARLRDWSVARAALVGTRGDGRGLWPSDHYGLLVRLEGVEGTASGWGGRRLGGGGEVGGGGGGGGKGGGSVSGRSGGKRSPPVVVV